MEALPSNRLESAPGNTFSTDSSSLALKDHVPALVLSDLYHFRVGGKSLLLNVPADSEAHWESAGLAGEAREANWYSTIGTAHTCNPAHKVQAGGPGVRSS